MKIIRKKNLNGPSIGSVSRGFIEKDGLFFKDLEGTGELLPYEDWRLSPEERAADLAGRLTVEEIAGLMMYSSHQSVPARGFGPFKSTYGGKSFEESGADPSDLTDGQKKFLETDHGRFVLLAGLENTAYAAKWNNNLQAFSESLPHGIPVNISSDPRHGASKAGAEYKSGGGQTSKWPEGLGIAATFDEVLCEEYASIISKEYRAMGISTALSPQVDVGTDPRWMRVGDTFGAHPDLVRDMGRAYCDGMQSDPEKGGNWGSGSVATMAKHWPGGGPCEAGRDAHYAFGKFAVHPGNAGDEHLKPFLDGAFKLNGPTKATAAIMPYYSITVGMDPSGKAEGNSYSKYIISDMLRNKYGFDGVVCTDWGITGDPDPNMDAFGSRCFGAEELTESQRHFKILDNGVDQFGGNNNIIPILEAYKQGCETLGEEKMRERFEKSAVRLLTNSFRCGLFDDPYLDEEESASIMNCEEHFEKGFNAQLRSVVMVKNDDVLPVSSRKKVYIPNRFIAPRKGFMRQMTEASEAPGADAAVVKKYFDQVNDPKDADLGIVFIESPMSDGGYTKENGYTPISLMYRPYTAKTAREQSIGQGDFREKDHPNRSYKDKTGKAANERDLDIVLETRAAMGDKPVIVIIRMNNPCVLSELEKAADAILIDFGVQQDAIFTLISGKAEPSGLLPVQLPRDMETVEAHFEDKPLDMIPYTDSMGNTYDFAFGLNFSGIINDERVTKYRKDF